MSQQKTTHYNVTNLTPSQRRKLFIECMNQTGFTAFIKNQTNQQTHYTFQYEDYNANKQKISL
jgi:hypothetical protein